MIGIHTLVDYSVGPRDRQQPRVHIFPGWEKVQCSWVLICLSSQTFSRLSSVKHVGRHGRQPQTPMVDIFCWHSFLDMTSQPSTYLGYDELSLQPRWWDWDQRLPSLPTRSSWAGFDSDVHTVLQEVPSRVFLGNYCCKRTQPMTDSCPSCPDAPLHRL
jgi:hypothetical protein